MQSAVSVYRQQYQKAYSFIKNSQYGLSYQILNNLLKSLHQDTSEYPEDKLFINELILDILFAMAICKANLVKINPSNSEEYARSKELLDQALILVRAASTHFTSKNKDYLASSLKDIQSNLTMVNNTIHKTHAAIKYNYGCTLIENAHTPNITASQSIDLVSTGLQHLLDALSLYEQTYSDEFNKTIAAIYQMINKVLPLLYTNTAIIEKRQDNAQYQKEFTCLKTCYEQVLQLTNDHPDSTGSTLKFALHERIADLYSILSNDNNNELIKLAIYHYELSLDKSLPSKHEKNIKIYLSILGCYESLINEAKTPKEKYKCAYKMFTFMSANDLLNLSKLNPADTLELSSSQFVVLKKLAIHGETKEYAEKFVSAYESFKDDNQTKLNFANIYQHAKDYINLVAETHNTESKSVDLKRKATETDNTDKSEDKNNPDKCLKSTAAGTKIRFYKEAATRVESPAGSPAGTTNSVDVSHRCGHESNVVRNF